MWSTLAQFRGGFRGHIHASRKPDLEFGQVGPDSVRKLKSVLRPDRGNLAEDDIDRADYRLLEQRRARLVFDCQHPLGIIPEGGRCVANHRPGKPDRLALGYGQVFEFDAFVIGELSRLKKNLGIGASPSRKSG
jgi:hypothetical protein